MSPRVQLQNPKPQTLKSKPQRFGVSELDQRNPTAVIAAAPSRIPPVFLYYCTKYVFDQILSAAKGHVYIVCALIAAGQNAEFFSIW